MVVWQLQQAKAKLTELVKASQVEPQLISRHGVCESVVISLKRYEELVGNKENIVDFFRNSPLYGVDLSCDRDRSPPREIDL